MLFRPRPASLRQTTPGNDELVELAATGFAAATFTPVFGPGGALHAQFWIEPES
jgi:hypothetical protein